MWGLHGISAELSALSCGLGGPEQWLLGQELPWLPGLVGLAWGQGKYIYPVSNTPLAAGPRKSSSAWLSNSSCRRKRRKPRRLQWPAKP